MSAPAIDWHLNYESQVKILVVDDVEENIFTIKKVLKSLDGVVIDTASSGEEALYRVLDNDYAVVVLDVQMPNMDGFEVAQLIRSNIETAQLPIIFVTAINKEDKHIDYGYEVGAVDYLFKPINRSMLINKVKTFVELHAMNKQLERGRKEFELILNSMGECIVSSDTDLNIQYLNDTAQLVLSQSTDILHKPLFDCVTFYEHGTENELNHEIKDKLLSRDEQEFVYNKLDLCNTDKGKIVVKLASRRIPDLTGQASGILLTIQDVTEFNMLNEVLEFHATHDILTGTLNRSRFISELSNTIRNSASSQSGHALLFLDIDGFKKINDSFGHVVGDNVLKKIANLIAKALGKDSIIGRFGGDEFIILLKDLESPNYAAKICEDIKTILDEPIVVDNNTFHLSGSIGISQFPRDGIEPNSLIKHADSAMCLAKAQGKNKYQYYNKDIIPKSEQYISMSNDIHTALKENQFEVYYQPQFDSKRELIIGYEALVRWKHPEKGMIPPNEFITIAEDCGMIAAIDNFVYVTACKDIKQIVDSYHHDLKLSINVSPYQLLNEKYMQDFMETLTTSELDPSKITLEVTERVFAGSNTIIIDYLNQLKEHGFIVAIDDFGTGYSCLSYLITLPFDILKIDKVFVDEIEKSSHGLEIIRAIVNMSTHLDKSLVIEGVETSSQSQALQSLGCTVFQGYLYSKPLSFEDFTNLLENQQPLNASK